MSVVLLVSGQLTFPDNKSYEAAIERLGGWLDKDGFFCDECRDRLSETPDAMADILTIHFPFCAYRNIGSALLFLIEGSKGPLVCIGDGDFEGTVIDNGEAKTFDLSEWAEKHVREPQPGNDAAFEETEWSNLVIEHFMACHLG